MKKNLYYQTVFSRHNMVKSAILDFGLTLASYPRLLLEVFTRKNFGERYFSFASGVTVAVLMFLLPSMITMVASGRSNGFAIGSGAFWKNYATWYAFLGAYIYFLAQRKKELKRNPSVFDFSRFSLYTGDIHPFVTDIKIFGLIPSIRSVEIFIEPGIFFLAGVLLAIIGQPLGYVLIVSAVLYSLSYASQYKRGDDFVMDKIDEMILNEELESAFVNDQTADNTRGVRFYARKPKAKVLRQKVADSFVVDQNIEARTYAE